MKKLIMRVLEKIISRQVNVNLYRSIYRLMGFFGLID